MNRTIQKPASKHRRNSVLAPLILLAALIAFFPPSAFAQGNQLSLADILIALRSKRASLPDRNKIVTEAIIVRGTTFTLTPEIEKELTVTGADSDLLESIRRKSAPAKFVATSQPRAESKSNEVLPKTEPAPPRLDFAFYQERADAKRLAGQCDEAITDYTKALGMRISSVASLVGRGICYLSKGQYALAIADLSKVSELDPKNAVAFARRGEAFEKNGNADLAMESYNRAVDLDPMIEPAKSAVERYNAEQAQLIKKPEVAPAPITPAAPVPEYLELGQLAERASRLVKPVYSKIAREARIIGQVVVEVELDTEGNVTKAKVLSGNQYLRQASEDAARRSKFKPAMVGDKAVKGRGRLVYDFVISQ
jgi:TonB family protein